MSSTTEIPSTVTPLEAHELCGGDPSLILLDVRTPGEFSARRAVGAKNAPLDSLGSFSGSHSKQAPILLLCEKGGRASVAAVRLLAEGFANVRVVAGGTEAWAAASLPVEGSGRKVISIERQVRIGAGSLVLLGVLGGFLLNPGLYLLSGFVGAGLVFAGITDWCGMGLLLGKAPWNR